MKQELDLCLAVQLFFIAYEVVQLWSMGFTEYISDPWNLNDILNFALFVPIYYYGSISEVTKSRQLDLYEIKGFRLLCYVELLSMMVKMMFLMRVFVGMGKIVELVAKTLGKSYQFLLFFAAWIIA